MSKGARNLFGGEEDTAGSVGSRVGGVGDHLSAGARRYPPGRPGALARHGKRSPAIVPRSAAPAEVKKALAGLPVAALRLDADVVEALVFFGLDRIGNSFTPSIPEPWRRGSARPCAAAWSRPSASFRSLSSLFRLRFRARAPPCLRRAGLDSGTASTRRWKPCLRSCARI